MNEEIREVRIRYTLLMAGKKPNWLILEDTTINGMEGVMLYAEKPMSCYKTLAFALSMVV